MKHIVVTGCAGLIGSHLVERLLAEGHRVQGIDNFYTGRHANLPTHKHFQLLETDVSEAVVLGHIDQVYHLACPASPVHYQRDPAYTLDTAYLGTRRALMWGAEQTLRPRVLIASTSEIYGDPLEHPQHESYWGNVNTLGPRACYDEGKRAGETLAAIAARGGRDMRIARIFNTYGPRMAIDDGRVVSNFIVQALRGEPLTIYGSGAQTRSFGYVTDTVDGLVRLMEYQQREPDWHVCNVGTPREFTVLELADMIRERLHTPPHVFKALPQDDPVRRCPDITRARMLLDFEPQVSLAAGLDATIAYFKSALHA